MDAAEAAGLEEALTERAYRWNTEGTLGQPFGPVLTPLVSNGATREKPLADALEDENTHALCLTVPAKWYDVAAERICDIMHDKTTYANRAFAYSKVDAGPRPAIDATRVYIVQLFFQLATVLWRWRDRNDRLPWENGGMPQEPESDDGASGSDGEDAPAKKKKRRARPRLLGAVRSEAAMAIDWRWRTLCAACKGVRSKDPWAIIYCDHVDDPRDASPVLDYTFWFVVRGWPLDVWRKRVGYAMIAVLNRMHLTIDGEQTSQGGPGEPHWDDNAEGAHARAMRAWNRRQPDNSDMWKNVGTPGAFYGAARLYLRYIGFGEAATKKVLGADQTEYSYEDLVDKFCPAEIFSPETTAMFLRKQGYSSVRARSKWLLSESTLEIQYSDVSMAPRFWRKYLPHYDLMCVRSFQEVLPGAYHPNYEDLVLRVREASLARRIPFIGPSYLLANSRLPIRSNSEKTTIWRLADEAQQLRHDADSRLHYTFLRAKRDLFTEEELAVVPHVWRHVVRKQAFAKYVMLCRSAESHLSHALVGLWHHFHETNGSAYKPDVIRPLVNGVPAECPWAHYYHNLSPFGNLRVNGAYHMWSYYNVDPPQMATAMLVGDCAANATRGELDAVGLSMLVHSTDPGAGKTFVTGELLNRTRVKGTVVKTSHKSAGGMNMQREGTHDDMVVFMDEIKRSVLCSKEEGNMADTKFKELMSSGRITTRVMQLTGRGGVEERDELAVMYQELASFIATTNMRVMEIPDKPALSRWIVKPHNKCTSRDNRRPRTEPRPPAHVRMQQQQLQYAVTELHKLVQADAMDVEDTFVVDMMLDALGGNLVMTPETQRRDGQIKSLARLHALSDLVVTHFWLPGGLFYGQTITPSRLTALNDFMMVRSEHVVFAIGQVCNTGEDALPHVVAQGIVALWSAPNHSFTVRWGSQRDAADWPASTSGQYNFAAAFASPSIDTVVFEGASRKFSEQFAHAVRNAIVTRMAQDPDLAQRTAPTVDQICSLFRHWGTVSHIPQRAKAARDSFGTIKCHPSVVEFTDEVLAPEFMCLTSENRGLVALQFPTHMLLTMTAPMTVIEKTPLDEMLRYSTFLEHTRAAETMGRAASRDIWNFSYLYGGPIPSTPQYYSTISYPRASREETPPVPMIPYRYYESVMTTSEYTALTGASPPRYTEDRVPMVMSLDDFAARSRIRTTKLGTAFVNSELFGRVLAKLVFSDFARNADTDASLQQVMRATMMTWGFMLHRSPTAVYDNMRAAFLAHGQGATERSLATNVLCDYRWMVGNNVKNTADACSLISRRFTDVRRARAAGRQHSPNAAVPGAYAGLRDLRVRTTYPENTPRILLDVPVQTPSNASATYDTTQPPSDHVLAWAPTTKRRRLAGPTDEPIE